MSSHQNVADIRLVKSCQQHRDGDCLDGVRKSSPTTELETLPVLGSRVRARCFIKRHGGAVLLKETLGHMIPTIIDTLRCRSRPRKSSVAIEHPLQIQGIRRWVSWHIESVPACSARGICEPGHLLSMLLQIPLGYVAVVEPMKVEQWRVEAVFPIGSDADGKELR